MMFFSDDIHVLRCSWQHTGSCVVGLINSDAASGAMVPRHMVTQRGSSATHKKTHRLLM